MSSYTQRRANSKLLQLVLPADRKTNQPAELSQLWLYTNVVMSVHHNLVSRHDNPETLLPFRSHNDMIFVNTTGSSALRALGHLDAPHSTQLPCALIRLQQRNWQVKLKFGNGVLRSHNGFDCIRTRFRPEQRVRHSADLDYSLGR